MSRFDFQHKRSGEVIEREYPIGQAPQRVRVGGRTYHRILTLPQSMHIADNVAGRRVSFMSHSIDPDHYKFHNGEFAKDHDGKAVPVFSNARQRDAFKAAAADNGVSYEYEGDVRHAYGSGPR